MKFKVGDEVIVVGVISPIGTVPGDARVVEYTDYEDEGVPYRLNCGTWATESDLLLNTDANNKDICATCGQLVEEEIVDMDEKVDVTMTLKQLSLIYGVFGELSGNDAVKQAQKSELVGKYIKDSDIRDELTFHMYTQINGILRDAEVIIDEL